MTAVREPPRGRGRLSWTGLRALGRRHRLLITVVGSLATTAVLVLVLAGRRHEFMDALSAASLAVLVGPDSIDSPRPRDAPDASTSRTAESRDTSGAPPAD